MQSVRHRRKPMAEINVVPYIDVMLVLLVIFMVTAPMIQTGSVDLPSVGKSSQPPVAPLEVIIKADTSLALRDRAKGSAELPVTRADLAALPAANLFQRPQLAGRPVAAGGSEISNGRQRAGRVCRLEKSPGAGG